MSSWATVTIAAGDAAGLPSVEARFSGQRTFDASSTPRLADAQYLLDAAESELKGALRARGMGTFYAAGTEGQLMLGFAAISKVVGTIRRDDAAHGMEDAAEDVGAADLAAFDEILSAIRGGQVLFDKELSGDGTSSAETMATGWRTHDVATTTPRIQIGGAESGRIW